MRPHHYRLDAAGPCADAIARWGWILAAPRPWYDSYRLTSGQWGTSALADQQLAGLLMWVPLGMVYPAVAVRLLLVLLGLGPPATSGAPGVA